MPNFFLVTAVIGIFSGSTLSASAQSSVNIERMNASLPAKVTSKFIESIEINPGTTAVKPAISKAVAINTTAHTIVEKDEVAAIEKCSALQFKYALLLDMDVEAVSNKVLFDDIDKWLDTRYRYGGTTEKGIDCSAYTGTLLSDVYGLDVPRTSRAQYQESEKVEKENLQQGDLVFFHTTRRGRGVSHVGLYLGNGYFTHAGSSSGVTISNLEDSYWSSKFLGGGRLSSSASVAMVASASGNISD